MDVGDVKRGSVVECGGKPWRDTALVCRTVPYGPENGFPTLESGADGGKSAPCPFVTISTTLLRRRERLES